jgi:hypothetical protein
MAANGETGAAFEPDPAQPCRFGDWWRLTASAARASGTRGPEFKSRRPDYQAESAASGAHAGTSRPLTLLGATGIQAGRAQAR